MEIPYIAVQALIFGLITYFMINYERNIGKSFFINGLHAFYTWYCFWCFNSTFYYRKIAFVSCFPVPYFHLLHILRDGGSRLDPNTRCGSSCIICLLLLVESSLWVPHPPIRKLLNCQKKQYYIVMLPIVLQFWT